jgi:hypothetical protein
MTDFAWRRELFPSLRTIGSTNGQPRELYFSVGKHTERSLERKISVFGGTPHNFLRNFGKDHCSCVLETSVVVGCNFFKPVPGEV